jgi:hypothetical protein
VICPGTGKGAKHTAIKTNSLREKSRRFKMPYPTAIATVVALSYPNGFEYTQKTQILRGEIGFELQAGSPPFIGYYLTGGVAVNFNANELVKTADLPFEVLVWSATGSGYTYVYNTSTKKLQIFVQSGVAGNPLEELPNDTDLTTINNDLIQFKATFPKFGF